MSAPTPSPYRVPIALWFAAVAGLVLALLGDGLADVVGLGLLAAPLGVMAAAFMSER